MGDKVTKQGNVQLTNAHCDRHNYILNQYIVK
jgi:hypothetical protein